MPLTSKYWLKRTAGVIEAIHPSTKQLIHVNPQKDCVISEDLDREWTRYPALVAWYRALRDTAKDMYREARFTEHQIEEDLYSSIRENNSTKGRVSETALKMALKTNEAMRDAYRARMAAENMLQHLESALESIIDKRWALQSKTKLRVSGLSENTDNY